MPSHYGGFRMRDKVFRRRGLVSGLILIPCALLTLFSATTIAEGTWPDFILDAVAYATFVFGVVFRFWATLYVGGRKDTTVIMEGAYSVCRNPLYIGSLLIMVSTGFFLKSLLFAGGLTLTTCFYVLATVPSEETFLRERFGETYVRYCQMVPRYWPRFSLFSSPSTIDVNFPGLKKECKRALLWFWLPLMAEVIAHLRGGPWSPP